MELFDFLLLIIIGGFGLFGVWFGFFHTLGSLLGTMIGVFLASRNFEPIVDWLMALTGWEDNFSRVLVFTLLFILINRLVGFLFWVIDRMFNVVTRLPFLQGINRLFGLALGVFEGFITVGFFIHFHELFPFSDWLAMSIDSSMIAPIAIGMIAVFMPLMPDALQFAEALAEEGVEFGVDLLEDAIGEAQNR